MRHHSFVDTNLLLHAHVDYTVFGTVVSKQQVAKDIFLNKVGC